MAHAKEEVEEMTGLAGALVLNIGTLTPELVEAMLVSAGAANGKGIPVVLDAVGAGATRLRTDAARRLIEGARIDILKGNAGEIATLAGVEAEVRGVESMSVSGDPAETARGLAARLGNVVVVTGETDLVSDGGRVWAVRSGHPLMGRVVGTGCISTSTVGCFAAAGGDLMELAAEALAAFGTAGERAAEDAEGPGDFLGALYNEIERISRAPEGLDLSAEEVDA
jgi:hydroxyethylthiazole kinase